MNENTSQTKPSETNPTNPTPEGTLVDAETLIKMLFKPECRPTVRWLRSRQERKEIPFVKLGRLVFFEPEQVKQVLFKKT